MREGKSIFLFPFKLIWHPFPLDNYPAQIAISVPKKYHKRAVARNRIKRRTKEAYRLQKETLYHALEKKEQQLIILLIYVSHDLLTYEEIEKKLNEIIKRLIKEL